MEQNPLCIAFASQKVLDQMEPNVMASTNTSKM